MALLVSVLALLGVAHPGAAQEEAAEAAPEHRVRPGDTLWDLAARYLDDPFAWEELYRLNRERVGEPDRIFPGQILHLPAGTVSSVDDVGARPDAPGRGEPTRQEDPFGGPTVFDEGGTGGTVTTSLSVEAAEPPRLVSRSDFYRAPWLGPRRLEPVGTVRRVLRGGTIGLELPPTVGVRDDVMLELTGPRVEVGTLLQAVRVGRSLEEEVRVQHPVGLLEVTAVRGDSARARVVAVYGRFEVGAPLVAAPEQIRANAVRTVPAEDSMTTRVTAIERVEHLVGMESVVFLDASGSGEIRPGDEFALFEPGAAAPVGWSLEDHLAVVRVVRVTPRGATARVVRLRDVGAGSGSPAVRIRRPAQ